MTTIALPRRRLGNLQATGSRTTPYSTLALSSMFCLVLFISFLVAYQTPMLASLSTSSTALLAALFVIIAPALALVLSVMSLRKYVKMHTEVKGMVLAYISFIISGIYFVTALAMPLVLLGLYVIYVYIW